MVNVFRADLAVGLAGCVMYLLALGLQTYVARAPLDFLDGEQNVFHIDRRARQPLRPAVCRGIARALRVFLEKEHPPVYTLEPRAEGPRHITVKPNTKLVRPTSCTRTPHARGTHDLDMIQGPFTYNALLPNEIKVKPLSQDKEFEAKELLVFYRTNPDVKHIKPYTDIIYDSPVYPMITDKNGVVLSL
ncbi:hypothetical protein PR002_g29084, partial [Phytophthora rubi]